MNTAYEIRIGFATGKSLFTFKSKEKRDETFQNISNAMKDGKYAEFVEEDNNSSVILDTKRIIMMFTAEIENEESEEDDDKETTLSACGEDILNFFLNGGNDEQE